MKKNAVVMGALILVLAMVIASQFYLGKRAMAQVGLESSTFTAAVELARQQAKPVIVDVSAVWCPRCRAMDLKVFADETVKTRLREAFVYTRVEFGSEEGKRVRDKYQVTEFPTILVLNHEAKVIKRIPLTYDPSEFVSLLADI